jgi:hypothetical protein
VKSIVPVSADSIFCKAGSVILLYDAAVRIKQSCREAGRLGRRYRWPLAITLAKNLYGAISRRIAGCDAGSTSSSAIYVKGSTI